MRARWNQKPDTQAMRFDPSAATEIADWKHTVQLLCCRVDPTGAFVVAGAIDGTIQRWDVATGENSCYLGHAGWVRTLGFQPAGQALYSGAYDGRLLRWDLSGGSQRRPQEIGRHDGWLRSLDVSHDGRRIVSCGNDKRVKVWSADDGELMLQMAIDTGFPYCVRFVPESYDVVCGDVVGHVHHWESQEGRLVRVFDAQELFFHIADIAPFGGVINLAFTADVSKMTVTGLHRCSNAPAGSRRAVALSFDWKTAAALPKQELLRKELDGTMWRAIHHPSGPLIGIVEKEVGFWKPDDEDVYHLVTTPSEIYDLDLHPNQIDLFTAHFDGHVRGYRLAATG